MPIESGVPICLRSLAASGAAAVALLGAQAATAPTASADTSATVEAQTQLVPQSVVTPQGALTPQGAVAPQSALAAQNAVAQTEAQQIATPLSTANPLTATTPTVDPARMVGRTSTLNPGTPGQCTWGAAQKWFEITGSYPGVTGDAWSWRDSAAAAGWTVVDGAQERSVVVFQPGVAGAGGYGHVAFVDSVTVRPDGKWIHVTEMNNPFLGGVGIYDDRDIKDVPGMSYILMP